MKHFKLSQAIKKLEHEIKLLRKVQSGAYGRNDGQRALELVSRLTKLYRESFPVSSTDLKKVKDVTIEDLIEFAENRADVLKNKLPKVKELSYAPRMDLAFSAIRDDLKAMERYKSEVERLEARLEAANRDDNYAYKQGILPELNDARTRLRMYTESYAYWKKFLDEKSVKAAKNILNSVEIAQDAVTNSEKQLATWRKEFDELNGMASPHDRNPAWFKWMQMYGRQKDIGLHIEISLAEVKEFAQGKIRIVEERLKREREILQNAQNLARSSQETEKLKNLANRVAEQGRV